jgi:hypothetical protein
VLERGIRVEHASNAVRNARRFTGGRGGGHADLGRPGRAAPVAGGGLRGSIDREVSAVLAAPQLGRRSPGPRAMVDQQSSGGGGGGGGWIIWTLLGTAASVGMGYYIMRQMRKQTNPNPAAAR